MQHAGRWLVRARGAEWGAAIRRYGPVGTARRGARLPRLAGCGWTRYSKVWMPLLGAYLALFIRSIVVQA